MKYLKRFENINTPQVGDYVIASLKTDKDIGIFIANNIGQIVAISENDINKLYTVKFFNIEKDIEKFFFTEPEYGEYMTLMFFYKYEILAFSKNKEELETILNANKYNL